METLKLEDGTEVVKLSDHNSQMAKVRTTATKGLIDPKSEEYTSQQDKLAKYEEAEFTNTATSSFTKYNGNPERVKDFMAIAGITKDTKPEDIEKKVQTYRKDSNYSFMFKTGKSEHELEKAGKTPTKKTDLNYRKKRW